MGIFDRLSTLLRSNINDLISRAEDPEKMLNQIIVDMRSQLAKAKQQVATAIADEKRLRDQADAEFKQGARLGSEGDARDQGRPRRPRQAGAHAPGRAQLARPAARADVGAAPARDRKAQELAPRPERQDRRSEAQEESAHRAPAPRAGAEAHRRNDVVAVREVGVRGVRPDGRAHREERAPAQGVGRDRRRVHRRPPGAGLQAAREGADAGQRRRAAARAQAEDGHAPRRLARGEEASAPGSNDEETVHAEIEDVTSEKKTPIESGRPARHDRRGEVPVRARSSTATVLTVLAALAVQDRRACVRAAHARRPRLAVPRRGRRLARPPDDASPKRMALAIAIIGSLGGARAARLDPRPAGRRADAPAHPRAADFIERVGGGHRSLAAKFPGVRDIVGAPGEHRRSSPRTTSSAALFGGIPTKLFEIVHAAINIFAVARDEHLSRRCIRRSIASG